MIGFQGCRALSESSTALFFGRGLWPGASHAHRLSSPYHAAGRSPSHNPTKAHETARRGASVRAEALTDSEPTSLPPQPSTESQ